MNSRVIQFILSSVLSCMISCNIFPEIEPAKCVPGWQSGGCFLGICWDPYYEDCKDEPDMPNPGGKMYLTINKVNALRPPDNAINIGDEVNFQLNYLDFYTSTSPYDSMTAEMCGGIFKESRSKNELLEEEYNTIYSGRVFEKRVTISENKPSGLYSYSAKAWSKGNVIYELTGSLYIYPKFTVQSECVTEKKTTILLYAPPNTPPDAQIQIRQIGADWPYETDSSYYLNKIDIYHFCISLDFRGFEKWTLLRDGNESNCLIGLYSTINPDCGEFNHNEAYFAEDSVIILTGFSWKDAIDLSQPVSVCN